MFHTSIFYVRQCTVRYHSPKKTGRNTAFLPITYTVLTFVSSLLNHTCPESRDGSKIMKEVLSTRLSSFLTSWILQ